MSYYKLQNGIVVIIEEKKKSRIKGTLCEEWELTDHTGQVRSSKDFRGSWTMVYCGFTHCPDVCPDELDKMVEAIELIGKLFCFMKYGQNFN